MAKEKAKAKIQSFGTPECRACGGDLEQAGRQVFRSDGRFTIEFRCADCGTYYESQVFEALKI